MSHEHAPGLAALGEYADDAAPRIVQPNAAAESLFAALADFDDGVGAPELAARVGCASTTAGRWLREWADDPRIPVIRLAPRRVPGRSGAPPIRYFRTDV